MPFKETCVGDEKRRFMAACLKGERTMTELCEAFGISRERGLSSAARAAACPTGRMRRHSRPHES